MKRRSGRLKTTLTCRRSATSTQRRDLSWRTNCSSASFGPLTPRLQVIRRSFVCPKLKLSACGWDAEYSRKQSISECWMCVFPLRDGGYEWDRHSIQMIFPIPAYVRRSRIRRHRETGISSKWYNAYFQEIYLWVLEQVH